MANNDKYDTYSKMRTSSLLNKCRKGGTYGVSLTSEQRERHKSIWKGGDKE